MDIFNRVDLLDNQMVQPARIPVQRRVSSSNTPGRIILIIIIMTCLIISN